jgi:ferredoxin
MFMAETHQVITKVWIAPGCIVCDSCENDCPEVFDVQEATCIIRPPAMNAEFLKPLTPSIIVAAEGCPVEVIKYETVGWSGSRRRGRARGRGCCRDRQSARESGRAARASRSEVAGADRDEQDFSVNVGWFGDHRAQEPGSRAG